MAVAARRAAAAVAWSWWVGLRGMGGKGAREARVSERGLLVRRWRHGRWWLATAGGGQSGVCPWPVIRHPPVRSLGPVPAR